MRRSLLVISTAAFLLFMVAPPVRADASPELGDATEELVRALSDLGITVSIAVLKEVSKAGQQFAREHLDVESWRGPAIEPDEYVGGFNLKLYPQGKSRSDNHFSAETFYRLDRNGLKELEFNAVRP